MTHLLFYTSSMPCEVGLAALFGLLSEITLVSQTIPQTKNPDALSLVNEETKTLVLVGSYWDSWLLGVSRKFPSIEILKVPVGDKNLDAVETIACFYEKQFALPDCTRPWIFRVILSHHRHTVDDINDRLASRPDKLVATQRLYAGLDNHPALVNRSLFDRFTALFNEKEVTRAEIVELGEKIVASQVNMAALRARENYRIVVASDGTRFAVTNAPELINICHQELHKLHGIDHTLTVALRFSNQQPQDQLQVSYRSFDPENPVIARAEAAGGGGDSCVAGARMEISIPWQKILG